MRLTTYLLSNLVLCLLVLPAKAEEGEAEPQFRNIEKGRIAWRFWRGENPDDATNTAVLKAQVTVSALEMPGLAGAFFNQHPAVTLEYRGEEKERFIQTILSAYIDIDLQFPGGTYADLERQAGKQIADAYKTQLPDVIRELLPQKIVFQENELAPQLGLPRITETRQKQVSWFHIFKRYLRFSTVMEPDATSEAAAVVSMVDPDPFTKNGLVNVRIDRDTIYFSLGLPCKQHLGTAFFNLEESPKHASKQSATDVSALFEIAWTSEFPGVWAQCKYHPETGVLVVKGTEAELATARNAFDALCRKNRSDNPFEPVSLGLKDVKEALSQQTEVLRDILKRGK